MSEKKKFFCHQCSKTYMGPSDKIECITCKSPFVEESEGIEESEENKESLN